MDQTLSHRWRNRVLAVMTAVTVAVAPVVIAQSAASADGGPTITSATSTSFTENSPGTFSVTTTGGTSPITLGETGALPSGVNFVDNGDGTATLSGTPAYVTANSYPIVITATDSLSQTDTQDFTLTVNPGPPTITSGNSATFTVGTPGTFGVTTSGDTPISLGESGALPTGVSFVDNGDGTATLSGTPGPGTGGVYGFSITATDVNSNTTTQGFTLTVDQAPAITSANATTFTVGTPGTFAVTTSGYPTAALNESGALPTGVSFLDNGNGTATLSGTPGPGTGGVYAITIGANNGIGSPASQAFTLTVDQAPAITSANTVTFTTGQAGTFTVTTTGFPFPPTLSKTGALPNGVTFVAHANGTATIAGTPTGGAGPYSLTITASNGVNPAANQVFTLVVDQSPVFISTCPPTAVNQGVYTCTVHTTGFPAPAITETGTLPTGLTFTDHGNGSATISGTVSALSGGSFPITLNADNGVVPAASQSFTITVAAPPVITTVSPATGSAAGGDKVTITGTGFAGVNSVKFGSVAATSYSVNGPGTKITVYSPPGVVGTVDIVVHSFGAGASNPGASDQFTYIGPTVTKVAPKSGTNGSTVTITGSGFRGATAVHFGAAVASTFVVSNSGKNVYVVVPPGTGTVDITVTTPGGTSPIVPADQFTY
ncbi:MAG TPA: putative Ig domain-containing protein [Acidimicrobiales bacterium]|nr:putative Ig domain-containing protein [Acidimicrobiales bacterium]